MSMLPDDVDSVIEDLDPEPAPGRWTRWREFALSVLLAIGVLGWSGGYWWQQEHNQSNYREAQEAEARRDWDAASNYYAAASGYKDADSKTAEADKAIVERNKQYKLAVTSARSGEWAASLQALKVVDGIQPHYRDAEKLIEQSEKEVYKAALLGAVAMRTGARPPGLYYMSEDGWHYLEESDKSSEIMGFGAPDHVVYNVPGEARLMAAAIRDGKVTFTSLGLNPDLHFGYIWSKHGVWGLDWTDRASQVAASPIGRSAFGSFNATYQLFTSSTTVQLSVPGPKWAIGDISPVSDQALLVDLSASDDEANPLTYLYLTSGEGSTRRLLFASEGGFKSVRFSPSGDHVIVHTYKVQPGTGKEKQTIALLDLKGGKQPAVLATGITPTNIGYGTQTPVSAAFIKQGAYAGKILVTEWGDYDDTFTLVDPERPDVPMMKGTFDDPNLPNLSVGIAPFDRSWVGYSSTNGLLLIWQNTKKYMWNASNSMTLVALSADSPPKVVGWYVADNVTLVLNSWVRDNNLVYIGVSHNANEHTFSIHSLPLPDWGKEPIIASAIYTTTKESQDPVYPEPTWYLGPQMLADSSDGNLHARTYNGKVDVILEQGVTRLFSLNTYESMYSRR